MSVTGLVGDVPARRACARRRDTAGQTHRARPLLTAGVPQDAQSRNVASGSSPTCWGATGPLLWQTSHSSSSPVCLGDDGERRATAGRRGRGHVRLPRVRSARPGRESQPGRETERPRSGPQDGCRGGRRRRAQRPATILGWPWPRRGRARRLRPAGRANRHVVEARAATWQDRARGVNMRRGGAATAGPTSCAGASYAAAGSCSAIGSLRLGAISSAWIS